MTKKPYLLLPNGDFVDPETLLTDEQIENLIKELQEDEKELKEKQWWGKLLEERK